MSKKVISFLRAIAKTHGRVPGAGSPHTSSTRGMATNWGWAFYSFEQGRWRITDAGWAALRHADQPRPLPPASLTPKAFVRQWLADRGYSEVDLAPGKRPRWRSRLLLDLKATYPHLIFARLATLTGVRHSSVDYAFRRRKTTRKDAA